MQPQERPKTTKSCSHFAPPRASGRPRSHGERSEPIYVFGFVEIASLIAGPPPPPVPSLQFHKGVKKPRSHGDAERSEAESIYVFDFVEIVSLTAAYAPPHLALEHKTN